MAKTGVVLKPFPYAEDGINVETLQVGRVKSFPDQIFEGLRDAKFLEETDKDAPDGETFRTEADNLNSRLVAAFDARLAGASDQELKDIIARSGVPVSGNLVHANLVAQAKAQLVAEAEGAKPVLGVDPNAGVTEQPLAAPGAPTPPSAASAVAQQQAQQDAQREGEGKDADADAGTDGDEIPPDWRDRHHNQQIAIAKRIDPKVSTKAEAVEVLEKATKA